MITVVSLIQLKAFARQDGFLLSLVWIVSFVLTVYLPDRPWGNAVAFTTPFVVGWLLVRFRNEALDGQISFRRGLAYSVYTFGYASMVFCLAQYLFFRFIDPQAFPSMLEALVGSLSATLAQAGPEGEELLKSMRTATEVFGLLSPIEIAFSFMMNNLLMGGIMSLPIAALCKRNMPQQYGN